MNIVDAQELGERLCTQLPGVTVSLSMDVPPIGLGLSLSQPGTAVTLHLHQWDDNASYQLAIWYKRATSTRSAASTTSTPKGGT